MQKIQSDIRKKILNMALLSKEGHIASSLSIVEILLAIYKYFEAIGHKDIFFQRTVLSKGHAVFALYALMNQYGFLSDEDLATVCQYGSNLIGHVPFYPGGNFNFATGSLGHGLPVALGKAYGFSLLQEKMPVFVVVGDGEFNEGSCWEALLLMKKFPNCRLRVIVDNNKSSSRAIPMSDIFNYISVGWSSLEVDGHNINELTYAFSNPSQENLIIICNTEKGFPLGAMMNNPIWHHKTPSVQEVHDFSCELDVFYGV